MPTFLIKHITKYSYSNPVFDGANRIMLYPINNDFQEVISQKITVSHKPKIETHTDFCSNTVGTFMVTELHNNLDIESEFKIITKTIQFPNDTVSVKQQWDALKLLNRDSEFIDFLDYNTFEGSIEIADLLSKIDLNSTTPYQMAVKLCDYIFTHFKYIQGITNVDSKLDHVWRLKAGVCQDFTNIYMQMIRILGIPARYVSGYICPSTEASRGEGATHAWAEVYIPFYGWLGFDPTNNIIASEHHVKLAVGRNYRDCAPVTGVYKGVADNDLFVKVEVNNVKDNNEHFVSSTTKESNKNSNSFRLNIELIQQQQQQQ